MLTQCQQALVFGDTLSKFPLLFGVVDGVSGNLIGASKSLRLPQASSVENENSGEPGCARSSLISSHFDGTFFNWPMAFVSG